MRFRYGEVKYKPQIPSVQIDLQLLRSDFSLNNLMKLTG